MTHGRGSCTEVRGPGGPGAAPAGTFAAPATSRSRPSIIQPAGLFLDVVGEALRARTYVFTDPDGEELCLRPDLTVPTCRLHLARHPGGEVPARYCYSGPAFRYQTGSADSAHPREFRQAGIESFAAADREQDDAAVLALIVEALRETGLQQFQLMIGDLGLFTALLGALPMPRRWRRLLRHYFWRPEAFHAELARLTSAAALKQLGVPRELGERLDPDKPEEAESLVAELFRPVRAGDRRHAHAARDHRARACRGRRCPRDAAGARRRPPSSRATSPSRRRPARPAGKIEALQRPNSIDLGPALDAFRRRLDLLEAAGVATSGATFSAEFGRELEYYTGFVFEIRVAKLGPKSPIAGGGRYDSLVADVGASAAVPAVGSSIHTERLLAVLSGEAP